MRFNAAADWERIGLTDTRQRFFYERWRELLDSASPVSHRAPVAGPLELLRELTRMQQQLRGTPFGKSALTAINEEFYGAEVKPHPKVRGTLESDPIIGRLAADLLNDRVASTRHFLTGGAGAGDQEQRDWTSARLLLHRLQPLYLPEIFAELERALFDEPAPREAIQAIDQLETALVSELLALGFADSFLRTHVRMLEARRPGATARERFSVFGDRLIQSRSEVRVIFRVQGSNEIWTNWPPAVAASETITAPDGAHLPEEWETFARPAQPVRFLVFNVEALDHHAASRKAFQLLQNAADLTFVRAPTREIRVVKAATFRGHAFRSVAVADASQMQFHRVPVPNSARADDLASLGFTSAFDKADVSESAKRRLSGALRYYRISIGQSWLESSLTNLWTALEVLASTNYDGPIIERVVRSVVPILSSGKVKDLTNDLLGYLLAAKINENEQFRRDFADVHNGPLISAVLLLKAVADPERAKQLANLVSELSPLLGHRVLQFHGYVSSGKDLGARVTRTSRRIEWQIRRLYRLRNDIVHGASVAPNAERLLEHLQMYVYSAVLLQGRVLAADNGLSTIEEVVSAVDLAFHSWVERIRTVRNIAEQDVAVIEDIYCPPAERLAC